MERFIEQYYNRFRLHSGLRYRPPEEFEHAVAPIIPSSAATIQWFRAEIRLDVAPSAQSADISGILESQGRGL
jgi:hypothetical protein